MQGSANLNIMVKAARAAARGLVKDFREVENLQVSSKGAGDFTARSAVAAEAKLREILMGERPNYGWFGAAAGDEAGKDPTRRWIVGPLDGTPNFLHGLPHWAVSIALEHKGEIVASVIFDAAKDELFMAERGQGAFVNDTRMRVSDRRRLIDGVFATGLPSGGRGQLPLVLKDLGRVLPASGGVRHMGSVALDLAYVAAGRLDGMWERGVRYWEVSAGMLLLREAGGLVEPIAGDSVEASRTIAGANADLFEAFAKVVRDF